MKKIVMACLLMAGLAYAGAFEDGMKAYKSGNYKEATKLFQKAADQGNAKAQGFLGIMYKYGLGVRQDCSEAAKWYKKAADQGHSEAQYSLGTMYFTGRCIRRDLSKAKRFYRQACDNSNQYGCSEYRYLSNLGVR